MDDMQQQPNPGEETKGYEPRPAWQVLAARIGLVVFILFVIYQIVSVARGGL